MLHFQFLAYCQGTVKLSYGICEIIQKIILMEQKNVLKGFYTHIHFYFLKTCYICMANPWNLQLS